MSTTPELVCVRKCQGMIVAQIFKSKLESQGIPVLLQYEAAGLVYGITIDGLGEVRILVPADLAGDARALLEDESETSGEEECE